MKRKTIFDETTIVKLNSFQKFGTIRYTIDCSVPNSESEIYISPLTINQTTILNFCAFNENKQTGPVIQLKLYKYTGDQSITVKTDYVSQYSAGGDLGLVDGIRGDKNFDSGKWQGYKSSDCEVNIKIDKAKTIHKIKVGCLQDIVNSIFFPKSIKFYSSEDGYVYKLEEKIYYFLDNPQPSDILIKEFSVNLDIKSKYIKIVANNIQHCPKWHYCYGEDAWIFLDEIIIE